jgi:hypothetical protein
MNIKYIFVKFQIKNNFLSSCTEHLVVSPQHDQQTLKEVVNFTNTFQILH